MQTFKLLETVHHGFFTPGRSYPLIRSTIHGNGGERGFYWDDSGQVRMVPVKHFHTVSDGEWSPPEPARYLPNKQLGLLAERIGCTKQSVYMWQRGTQPLRWYDLVAGCALPVKTDPVKDMREMIESQGLYMQEITARWNMQEFGQYLTQYAGGRRVAYFWDLWRGMLINTGQSADASGVALDEL